METNQQGVIVSKRFTDTDKWKKKWYRELSVEHKLFWVYLLDECDHSGVWNVEIEIASMRIGVELNGEELMNVFGDRIMAFDHGEKWFVPGFINFQYGILSESCAPHKAVINSLKRYGLYEQYLGEIIIPLRECEKGYQNPSERVKEKEKEKAQAKEKGKEKEKENKNVYLDFVLLAKAEHDQLAKELGSRLAEYIAKLNDYIGSKGKRYKSHYHTIRSWARMDGALQAKPEVIYGPIDPDCVHCRGNGILYAPGTGKTRVCSCRVIKEPKGELKCCGT